MSGLVRLVDCSRPGRSRGVRTGAGFLDEARRLGNTARPEFGTLVLEHLDEAEIPWRSIVVPELELEVDVMADALRIEGVRVNASAASELAVAAALDATLLTPLLSDWIYRLAEKQIDPQPRPITSSVQAMIEHSAEVDRFAAGADFIADPGKDWVYLGGKPGIGNYGWHGSKAWSERARVPVHAAAGLTDLLVVQQPYRGHGLKHSDYSQTIRLARRACRYRGEAADLEQLYSEGVALPTGARIVAPAPPIAGAAAGAGIAALVVVLAAAAYFGARAFGGP